MFPKILEMRQDRSLIAADFDGYKLSLDPIPVLQEQLSDKPLQAKPSEEQYSFLHVELFGMHNHLVQDPWDRLSSYFVTENGDIFKSFFGENDAKPSPLQKVGHIKNTHAFKPGDYNVTFLFASEKFAILCDGINEILLFDTGDRSKASDWILVDKHSIGNDVRGFVVRDSQIDTVEGQQVINLALQHVGRDLNVQSCVTKIFVGSLKQGSVDGKWEFKISNTLTRKGSVHYCSFDPNSRSLVLSSAMKLVPEHAQKTRNDADQGEPNYTWHQTEEDVTVKICRENEGNERDCTVTTTENNIEVKYCGDTVLAGNLYSSIDSELTTWTMEDDTLRIILVKKSLGHWPSLIKNQSESDDKQISNLDRDEECDIHANNLEEYTLERIELEGSSATHKIFLGGSPPLFCSRLRAGYPPAIIIRQDVDASVWLQNLNPSNPDEWHFKHEGNLHAFGYVQASKQQKKFMDCSPNLSYSVICESQRHVFIYKASLGSNMGLRNRNLPSLSLGKQHLVVLEDPSEVLGLVAADHFITILTEKFIFYLQLNQS